MATSETPTDAEIYWGIHYRRAYDKAAYYSDNPDERDEVARRTADAAFSQFRKTNKKFADGS